MINQAFDLGEPVVDLEAYRAYRTTNPKGSPSITEKSSNQSLVHSPSILDMDDEMRALSTLYNIFQNRTEAGWDGYHANPISLAAANGALAFVKLILRDGYSLPNFVPDPQGRIGMVWSNKIRELIVSINERNEIIFSVLDTRRGTFCGVLKDSDSIPDEIRLSLDHIHNAKYSRTGQKKIN